MADRCHELTDEILKELETRIADEYAVATNDMKRKLREYMEKFKAEDEKQKALLDAGKITQKEYSDWRYRHMMVGKRWEAMKDVLAEDLKHASDIALKISGEKMADVYALNANFATYQIEHDAKIDTGFTLYNHDTAEYLLKDQRQLMPGPSTRKAKEIAANKAMQWNKQKIQSAVLQGVLQGEGPHKVAERLRQVGQMDYNASVRYARTMTTSAQNAGRYNSFRRARDLGVDLTIEWMATLDSRTRHEHRMMHGQRTTVDEPFHTPDGYTIYYPADCTGESTAPQSMFWNCRCTIRAMVKGYERETIRSSPKMGDMTFEEWQNEKAPKQNAAPEATTSAQNAVRVKTKEEAKEELGKLFGSVEDSFMRNDEELIVSNTNQLLALNERFGAIPKDNTGGYITGSKSKRAIGYTSSKYREDSNSTYLGLVNQYYQNPEMLRQEEMHGLRTAWSMPFDPKNVDIVTVTHEYGHILESYISRGREDWSALNQKAMARMVKGGAPNISVYKEAERKRAGEIWREIVGIAKENNPNFKVSDNISKYGKTNYFEAFAETFANSQLGDPNELGNAMNEWLKREGF